MLDIESNKLTASFSEEARSNNFVGSSISLPIDTVLKGAGNNKLLAAPSCFITRSNLHFKAIVGDIF
jgi:hypothetical protein